jgi:putative membrane protein
MYLVESYHYLGMTLFWWIVWSVLLLWIFATPYSIPGQRFKKDSALDLLKKRYAKGEINSREYQEMKESMDLH